MVVSLTSYTDTNFTVMLFVFVYIYLSKTFSCNREETNEKCKIKKPPSFFII